MPNLLRGLVISVLGLLVLVLHGAMPAGAQTLPGMADPAFRTALDHWLADDEETALPAFAGLAQAGNPSAQFILALIDKTAALQGPWLALQPRAARIGVMRAPGGMSGTSWIDAAATAIPRAALWRALWRVDTPFETALEFMRADEPRAAREALAALRARERRGFAPLLDDPAYPAAMRYLGWLEWNDAAGIAAVLDTLHPGDPQRVLMGRPVAPDARAEWLLTAPEAAPVAAICSAQCPETRATCALALDGALGGTPGLLIFGTPSEALVPTDVFVASPRGQAALLRRVLLSVDARGRRQMFTAAQTIDACAAALIETESARYRYVRANAMPNGSAPSEN